jgi:ABC-type Zn uptake system ZnuABC Zn-binding protein ZnuA
MTRRALIALLALALCAPSLTACAAQEGAPGGSSGTTAVATTSPVGDLARAVAGGRAGVRQILRPNSDPHEYEPRPSDVGAVAAADVVLRSGGDLDEWLDGVLENAGTDAKVVTLLDAMPARRDGDAVDPHWWQNPRNAIRAVRAIRDALVRADPAGETAYNANAAAYVARLRNLDRAIAACMDAIPAVRRRLVTDHDALGYYADRYAIDVIGTVIPALSTQAQASAGEVARLVRTIRRARVTTIFPEGSANPKLARAIARDARVRVGPALYADTLGSAGSAGETYIGALRFNTQALAGGFAGRQRRCQL